MDSENSTRAVLPSQQATPEERTSDLALSNSIIWTWHELSRKCSKHELSSASLQAHMLLSLVAP